MVSAQLRRNYWAEFNEILWTVRVHDEVVHLIFCLHINCLICIIIESFVFNFIIDISLISIAFDLKPFGIHGLTKTESRHDKFCLIIMIMSIIV